MPSITETKKFAREVILQHAKAIGSDICNVRDLKSAVDSLNKAYNAAVAIPKEKTVEGIRQCFEDFDLNPEIIDDFVEQ